MELSDKWGKRASEGEGTNLGTTAEQVSVLPPSSLRAQPASSATSAANAPRHSHSQPGSAIQAPATWRGGLKAPGTLCGEHKRFTEHPLEERGLTLDSPPY